MLVSSPSSTLTNGNAFTVTWDSSGITTTGSAADRRERTPLDLKDGPEAGYPAPQSADRQARSRPAIRWHTGGHALTSTGKSLGQVEVGVANRFATPALYGADVIVPTLAGIAVVRTS